MWRRQPGQLNYTIITIHKLVPPPSRISNNATVNILCLAASLWLRCNTDPSRNTLVTPLHHTTTSFGPLPIATSGKPAGPAPGAASNSPQQNQSVPAALNTAADSPRASGSSPGLNTQLSGSESAAAGAAARLTVKTEVTNASTGSRSPVSVLPPTPKAEERQKEDHESLLVMTVSDDGHVWQWNVPLQGFLPPPKGPNPTPTAPQTPPAKGANPGQLPAALAKPALLGLLHTLPHSVTTFSVCPVPVGAGWAGDLNQPSGQSGEGGDAVAVLAAVTSAGNVELVTLQRGSLTPLSSTISVSLGVYDTQACHSAPPRLANVLYVCFEVLMYTFCIHAVTRNTCMLFTHLDLCCICIWIYVYMCVCVFIRIYENMHIHLNIYKYAYTSEYTHTCTPLQVTTTSNQGMIHVYTDVNLSYTGSAGAHGNFLSAYM